MSRAQDYANSVSSLYAQIGEARAREAANKGAIWSGALANIGDFVAQYPERKAKMEEIKNRAAMTELEKQKLQHQIDQDKRDADEDQKIRELFSTVAQEFGQAQQRGTSGVDPRFDLPRTNPNGMAPYFAGVGGIGPPQGASPPTPAPTQMRTSPLPSPSEILRTIGPKKGIPIINGLAALRQDPQGDPEKSLKLLQQVANGLNALPEDLRAQAYPEIVKSFEQRGIVKPGMLQAEYSPEYWKFIMGTGQEPPRPTTPELVPQPGPNGTTVYGPKVAGAPVVLTPDQAADNARQAAAAQAAAAQRDIENKRAAAMLSLAQQRELRESQNSKEPLIAVMKDGKAVLVKRSEAEGMTPASGEAGTKELTQAQTLDAGYAHRIDDAEETLKKVESSIAKMGLIKFTAESHLPAKAQSAEFQQYDQASRNLINAILRRESGAAISQSEFDNAKRQYLPQPGDTDETLKLKAQNRKRQKEALAAGAGRAYTPDTPAAGQKKIGRFVVEVQP